MISSLDPEKEKEKFVRDPNLYNNKFRSLVSPIKVLKGKEKEISSPLEKQN